MNITVRSNHLDKGRHQRSTVVQQLVIQVGNQVVDKIQ